MQRTGWSGNVTESNTVEMNNPVCPKMLQWFFPLLLLQCQSVAMVINPGMASFLPCQPASQYFHSNAKQQRSWGCNRQGQWWFLLPFSHITQVSAVAFEQSESCTRCKAQMSKMNMDLGMQRKLQASLSNIRKSNHYVKHGVRVLWKGCGLTWWKFWLDLEWLLFVLLFRA